jgi:glycosyltransferase involved in cell wall biosynthesis
VPKGNGLKNNCLIEEVPDIRIASVTATFPPYLAGTGHVAFHNARILWEHGHDVTVLTAGPAPGTEQAPFPVLRLPAVLRFGNASLTPQLLTALQKFDVIHLHYPYIFGAELTWLAGRRYGIPYVVTYHNQLQYPSGIRRTIFLGYNHLWEARICRGAESRVAVSMDHVTALGLDGYGKWEEIPNAVDISLFSPQDRWTARKTLGWPSDAPIALFVGALDQAHWFKGLGGLLRAWRHVSTDALLWVVGDGSMRRVYEDMAERQGIANRVHFAGAQSQQDLPRYYRAADITVLPSVSTESFGMVLIESMACGTPVVASSLPGVRSVVANGVDGLLVPSGDWAELAKAVTTLLDNRDLRVRMGQAGRRKVERRYSWDRVGVRLEEVLQAASRGRRITAPSALLSHEGSGHSSDGSRM